MSRKAILTLSFGVQVVAIVAWLASMLYFNAPVGISLWPWV